MPALSAYAAKALLDWMLGGASAPADPTGTDRHAVGLSLGAPTSVSGSEMTTLAYTRQKIEFAAAASPAGSATNSSAVTFGPFNGAGSVSGIQIWDTVLSSNSGNMFIWGLLATARTVASGDSLVIPVGALTVSLT